MNQFYTKPWKDREVELGDGAETMFEWVQKKRRFAFARYGLLRPDIKMHALPDFVRFTPDYLQNQRMVEVKGVGRDHTLKIKDKQVNALCVWHDMIMPVDVFVWDSYKRRYTEIPVVELYEDCHTFGTHQEFPEGPFAWFLDLDKLKLTWQSIDS